MSKLIYVIRILLASFGKKLCLIWLLILVIAFGLSMSIGIANSHMRAQSYYLNDDMRALAFFVDSVSGYYTDAADYANSVRTINTRLAALPGLAAVYEQVTLTSPQKLWLCYGYPEELVKRLHLPSAKANAEVGASGRGNEIWLDNRLSGQYQTGDALRLELSSGKARISAAEFFVAGFLNAENAHYNFHTGASYDAYSENFIVLNPDNIVCVLIADSLFADEAFDCARSSAKFLLPEEPDDIYAWKQIARAEGLGHVSDMQDILENDRENTEAMTQPILILCIIMLILTLVGLIGTQIQLIQLYKQAAFSLMLCGMTWRTWKAAWLTLFCSTLLIASMLGASLGNAWKTVVMIEPMRFISPISLSVSAVIVLIAALGIIPTISRHSNVDINEFRRLCE